MKRAIAALLIATTLSGCMEWHDTHISPKTAKNHLRIRTGRSSWIDLFDVRLADDSLHGQIHRSVPCGTHSDCYFKTVTTDTTIAAADVTAVQDRQYDDVANGVLVGLIVLTAVVLATADYSSWSTGW